VKIGNFTKHLKVVHAFADSDVPISYVDLVWSALPAYHSTDNKLAANQAGTHCQGCGTLASAAELSASGVTDGDVQESLVDTPLVCFSQHWRARAMVHACRGVDMWLCHRAQCTVAQCAVDIIIASHVAARVSVVAMSGSLGASSGSVISPLTSRVPDRQCCR
jgi:hypothetical protein